MPGLCLALPGLLVKPWAGTLPLKRKPAHSCDIENRRARPALAVAPHAANLLLAVDIRAAVREEHVWVVPEQIIDSRFEQLTIPD